MSLYNFKEVLCKKGMRKMKMINDWPQGTEFSTTCNKSKKLCGKKLIFCRTKELKW